MLFVECLGASKVYMRDNRTYFSTPIYANFGIAEGLELRGSSNGNAQSRNPDATSNSGASDRWGGLKWRAVHDGILRTDLSFQYMHKFPTAEKGLGSGAPDDSLGLIINRSGSDWSWVDFRIVCTWLGRSKESGGGTVRQPSIALTLCYPLGQNWSLGGKLSAYGQTSMTQRTVTFGSFLSRKIASRLYGCVGLECGLNRDAYKYSAFLGINFWVGPPKKNP